MKSLDLTLLIFMVAMIILLLSSDKSIDQLEEELNNKGGLMNE